MNDLLNITGYRTNKDGTETLAWLPREDGVVECVHAAPGICAACIGADSRLVRNDAGAVVVKMHPAYVRDGRTVTFRSLA